MNRNKKQFKKPHKADYVCENCGFNCTKGGEMFYLHTEIWYRITLKWKGVTTQKGILCIKCCQDFLGRPLSKGDFNDSYVNKIQNFHKSARLLNCLSR